MKSILSAAAFRAMSLTTCCKPERELQRAAQPKANGFSIKEDTQ
jgi:hypothetical protein